MTTDAKRRRALVVDDDADIRQLIAALLDSAGFDADLISDGIQALEVTRDYDAILVDLNMPVFDGERLLEYWSLTQKHLLDRVIVLTGFLHYTRGRPLPATFASIAKPFAYDTLIGTVQRCAAQKGNDDEPAIE
jgi:DNA-binding NtrC family response regulator